MDTDKPEQSKEFLDWLTVEIYNASHTMEGILSTWNSPRERVFIEIKEKYLFTHKETASAQGSIEDHASGGLHLGGAHEKGGVLISSRSEPAKEAAKKCGKYNIRGGAAFQVGCQLPLGHQGDHRQDDLWGEKNRVYPQETIPEGIWKEFRERQCNNTRGGSGDDQYYVDQCYEWFDKQKSMLLMLIAELKAESVGEDMTAHVGGRVEGKTISESPQPAPANTGDDTATSATAVSGSDTPEAEKPVSDICSDCRHEKKYHQGERQNCYYDTGPSAHSGMLCFCPKFKPMIFDCDCDWDYTSPLCRNHDPPPKKSTCDDCHKPFPQGQLRIYVGERSICSDCQSAMFCAKFCSKQIKEAEQRGIEKVIKAVDNAIEGTACIEARDGSCLAPAWYKLDFGKYDEIRKLIRREEG